jgi:hypothetical protein
LIGFWWQPTVLTKRRLSNHQDDRLTVITYFYCSPSFFATNLPCCFHPYCCTSLFVWGPFAYLSCQLVTNGWKTLTLQIANEKKIAWWHLELTHLHPIECGLICCSEHKNYHRSVILSGHSQSMLPHLGAASVYLCSEIQNWELQKYIESNAKTVEEAFIPVLLFVIPPNAVRSALWVAMSFLCF